MVSEYRTPLVSRGEKELRPTLEEVRVKRSGRRGQGEEDMEKRTGRRGQGEEVREKRTWRRGQGE